MINFDKMMAMSKFSKETCGTEDYEQLRKAYQKVDAKERLGLIITGVPGCGKTHAVRAMFPYMPIISCALHVQVDKLSQKSVALNTWHIERGLIEYRCGTLIIDDVGSEKINNDYGVLSELVGDYISERYEYMRWSRCDVGKLIITTNLDSEALGKRYGARVLSRLSELCVPVRMNGKDKRGALPQV